MQEVLLAHRAAAAPVTCAKFDGTIFPLDGGVCRLVRTASLFCNDCNRARMLDTTAQQVRLIYRGIKRGTRLTLHDDFSVFVLHAI